MEYNFKGNTYVVGLNPNNQKMYIIYNNIPYYTDYPLDEIKNKIIGEANKISKLDKISSLSEKKKILNYFNINDCISKNIQNERLIFGIAYSNCLPSIWNLYPEDDNNGKKDEEIDSFQINFYSQPKKYKLSLIYFKEKSL